MVPSVDLETLVVPALVVAVVAGLAWVRSRRAADPSRDPDGVLLDSEERRMLDEAFAAVEREHAEPVRRFLASRVVLLHHRRVPLRAVRPSGEPPIARLCFANGTVLRARPAGSEGWAPLLLAVGARGESVVVESYSLGEGDVSVVLAGPGRVRRHAVVVGVDQPE